MPDVAYHGWTHKPKAQGGTDPTEIEGGVGFFPVVHSVQGAELETLCDQENNEAFTWVYDLATPFSGGYIDSTAFNTDLKGMIFGLGPLGPGTAWGIDIWAKAGPDQGKLQIEYGTTLSDELSEAGFGSENSGTAPDETLAAFSGWWKSGNTGVRGDNIDLYNAVAQPWSNSIIKDRGRIAVGGADGSMLTADGTTSGLWSDQKLVNGGGDKSVFWWLKLSVNGKHASSSAYGLKIAGFRMYRQTAGATTWWAS